MLVTVIPHVDPANDTVVFIMDLTGNDPFQHEFLKEVFADALATTRIFKRTWPTPCAIRWRA